MNEEKTNKEAIKKESAGNPDLCSDSRCPEHGSISIRGRNFEGHVKKIVGNRAVIEWERILYVQKYERYEKRRSKMHAHIPSCLISQIKEGSRVIVGECRPLSKITHSVVLEVIK